MTDFQVDVTALRSAATQFSTLQGQARQQVQALGSVQVGPMDFGQFPGQTSLFASYQSSLQQCQQAMGEVAESLGKIHEGLGVTADLYDEVERQAQEVANEFFGGI